MKNRFSKTNNSEPQDAKQVWFPGVHADVGGGYPERESGLSKYPLLWMIDEARDHGLAFNTQAINQLVWGVKRKGSPFDYVGPDFIANPHDSLRGAWRILEKLPKRAKYREWPSKKTWLGFYIPNREPRFVGDDVDVHESVLKHQESNSSYQPENLPDKFRTVPISDPPKNRTALVTD